MLVVALLVVAWSYAATAVAYGLMALEPAGLPDFLPESARAGVRRHHVLMTLGAAVLCLAATGLAFLASSHERDQFRRRVMRTVIGATLFPLAAVPLAAVLQRGSQW